MAKSKKEKKQARRERQEQLRAAAEHIQEKLLVETLEPKEEVEYVLDDPSANEEAEQRAEADAAGGSGDAKQHRDGDVGNEEDDEEDEDRVEMPPTASAAALRKAKKGARNAGATGRKHHRMSWQALKLAVSNRYGADAAETVTEHDGNAEDPFFTVLLKMQPHTVPVPRHWDRLRSFMSLQADREEAVGLVPAEIQALGVDKIRAAKDKRANPDQIAFMTCFMTGTPLQRKTFHVQLTPFGDVFREGKWMPKAQFEPGKLSQRLRQALGMGPHAPPPWLYSMQTMRRLPPAYPRLRVPGLNAPIPAGAQWGRGQGQWGDPPRGENNNFLFPGLMDESADSVANAPRLWGVVPALEAADAAGEAAAKVSRPPPPQPQNAAPAPSPAAASTVTITPTPFRPQAYQPQVPTAARYVSSVPQEYVRVQDSGAGATVAIGHKMVRRADVAPPKTTVAAAAAAKQPPQPTGKQPAQQPQQRPGAKQPPPPPNPRSNRGTKF